jgi:DNA-binding CsgD family transcriptional regulator
MLRSMATLGLLYERFGKAGEGDTAYFYCDEGLRMADANRFPYETALLENSFANCLRHSHQYDSAIFYFERSFALIDSSCLLYHKNALEKAFVHYRAQDYATALADLEVAYQSKDENLKTQAAYGLADCYEALGDTLNAMPYYALVKTQEEKIVTAGNHNGEVMPMLNAYLKEKEPQQGGKTLIWLLVLLATAAAFVVYLCVYRKRMTQANEAIQRDLHEAHGALEAQANEALRIKVQAIYDDKRNNTFGRILEVFNTAYPDALSQLKAAYPSLNDTELDICVLSYFPFRMKEIADILDLRENTVSKYRTSIKKKTQTGTFEGLWAPFVG